MSYLLFTSPANRRFVCVPVQESRIFIASSLLLNVSISWSRRCLVIPGMVNPSLTPYYGTAALLIGFNLSDQS